MFRKDTRKLSFFSFSDSTSMEPQIEWEEETKRNKRLTSYLTLTESVNPFFGFPFSFFSRPTVVEEERPFILSDAKNQEKVNGWGGGENGA